MSRGNFFANLRCFVVRQILSKIYALLRGKISWPKKRLWKNLNNIRYGLRMLYAMFYVVQIALKCSESVLTARNTKPVLHLQTPFIFYILLDRSTSSSLAPWLCGQSFSRRLEIKTFGGLSLLCFLIHSKKHSMNSCPILIRYSFFISDFV